MQGPEKISTKERSFAELRFASSLAPFWVWPGRRQGSAMNAYGALDPGLATQLPSCGLFSLQSPNKSVDNADVVIHGPLDGSPRHQQPRRKDRRDLGKGEVCPKSFELTPGPLETVIIS